MSLPPGWEARFDMNTGRTYYLNHVDKISTWDKPTKNKKSTTNGTPKIQPKQSNASSKGSTHLGVEHISLQDFSNKTRGSPLNVRSKAQESSLTKLTETDEAVSKISAMFPTVSEPHIRLLMKNCRYMKSIFPQAEETIILDILYNHDNNIQKSSDRLREMGFEKKDSLKASQQKHEAKIKAEEIKTPPPKSPACVPKVKSVEEKGKIKMELVKEFKNMPEQLVAMALESVDFDKEKAINLLKATTEEVVKPEEGKILEPSVTENDAGRENTETTLPVSQSRQSIKSLLKSDKNDKEKNTFNRVIDECNTGLKSKYLSNTKGPNPTMAKGNNDNLLLEDYVKWQGPNPNLWKGPQKGLAKGPTSGRRFERSILACGPNADLQKGPNKSLVKGSIFQQMKSVVAVGGECRGK